MIKNENNAVIINIYLYVMEIDRHDYVKKLNIYNNNYTKYIIDVIYNLFAQYLKYIMCIFEKYYIYTYMEIKNSKYITVYNSIWRKNNIILTDSCIILSNNKNPINIPYENITRFEYITECILVIHVLGNYDNITNNIYLDDNICHITIHCTSAMQCFNKMRNYMYYHLQFNKFNLDVIDIYNNKRKNMNSSIVF